LDTTARTDARHSARPDVVSTIGFLFGAQVDAIIRAEVTGAPNGEKRRRLELNHSMGTASACNKPLTHTRG
jgi:hypothetical protein